MNSNYTYNKNLIDLTITHAVWNCPTFIAKQQASHLKTLQDSTLYEMKYLPKKTLDWWYTPGMNIHFDKQAFFALMEELHNKGGKIVAGTDAGFKFVIPGFSYHEELALMNQAGLSPYEVLTTATKNPAELLGTLDHSGTIEQDKIADVILLNENPFENIHNTRSIEGVMTKGIWLSKEKLQTMLDTIEVSMEKYNNDRPTLIKK